MSLMYYEAQVSERKSERERERKKKTEREREGAREREREREPLSQISIRRALDTKSNLSLGECIE